MTAAYRKKGFPGFYMRVPVRAGEGPVRSLCTSDERIKNETVALVKRLKAHKRWELLEGVTSTPPRITLGQLYYADRTNRLDELVETLRDTDLLQHLDGWEKWVRSNLGSTGTAEMYRMQVSTLMADPDRDQPERDRAEGVERIRWLSELETPRVSAWLATRTKKNGEPPTTGYKLKLLYALFSFVSYLREIGVVKHNPIEDIKRPKRGRSRVRWETEENDIRIVDATPAEFRGQSAFIKATGADVSATREIAAREIELWTSDSEFYCGVAHIPGTKTETRDRHDALIEKWARPYIAQALKSVLPNTKLWAGISRYKSHYHHEAACKAVEIEDYTLRDSRHSWAVRGRKYRGNSFEDIAAQLGNTPYQAATTYAQFKPTLDERIGKKSGQNSTISATSDRKVVGRKRGS